MPAFRQAVIITWGGLLLGQRAQWQITVSPTVPVNWDEFNIDNNLEYLYQGIGRVEALSGTLGSDFAGYTPTEFRFTEVEFYFMQQTPEYFFFRSTLPLNVDGFRAGGGQLSTSNTAISFSSATTLFRQNPASFRLPGVLEADTVGNDLSDNSTLRTIMDEIPNQLNTGWTLEQIGVVGSDPGDPVEVPFVTTVVERIKLAPLPGQIRNRYLLPSLPGEDVLATQVNNWEFSEVIGSQNSRKPRRGGA